jgi:hypothetical protein
VDPLLEFGHRQRIVVQAAFQQGRSGFDRMHVAVHEAGHQEPSRQVHADRLWPDERREPGLVADVDDATVADRERLRDRAAGVGRENDRVDVGAIGRSEAGFRVHGRSRGEHQ